MKKFFVLMLLFMFSSAPALAAGGKAVLTWDANREADLAGYKVYYGTATRTYGPAIDVGKTGTPAAPSHTITLPDDGTYFFAVTAYDTAGNESGFSTEVSKTIDGTPPAPPSNFRVLIEKLIAFLRSIFGG